MLLFILESPAIEVLMSLAVGSAIWWELS